ncbi:autotransporter outer membrane beta-barrel domain-containing protein [Pelagerythrobacter marensis]|uniref:autotransporter outer membrane beta-barrel domain-containing protein n=1 Tax=Pelagerythrobacter marensis TaxID=543877 RepID=UPI00069FF469|nr:autotransporter domain-containing protein [Pelagerythrobacter marensis]
MYIALVATTALAGVLTSSPASAQTVGAKGDVDPAGAADPWIVAGPISVGDTGEGELLIANSGLVDSDGGSIGVTATGSGAVTVRGEGSFWANNAGDLTIGDAGSGTLRIEDQGAVTNIDGYIGRLAGSAGTVTVDGPASIWVNELELFVGAFGDGTLLIENGGKVSDLSAYVGVVAGATGEVTVRGAGSVWTNDAVLVVGEAGSGVVRIEDGGAVSSHAAYVGVVAGATGEVTVRGAGSVWTNDEVLVVGATGSGALRIEDGGTVSNLGDGEVGVHAGSASVVNVQGVGSSWTNGGNLLIGDAGEATMTIANGGAVSNNNAAIGSDGDSSGTVIVTGAGSNWTNDGILTVGTFGNGALSIAEKGVVTVDSGFGAVIIAAQATSTGTLNIGTGGAAGILSAESVIFGTGAGTLNFDHTEESYDFDPIITGVGTINQLAGVTRLTADSAFFTGTTNILGGSLYVNNALGGTVNVTGGVLGGTGQVGTTTLNSGGTIAPGNSIGTLNVAGDLTIEPGSVYEVEVNALGESDLIVVAGTVTINGGEVRIIPFPDFAVDTPYSIITANGGSGAFDSVSFGTASLFITPTLAYGLNAVTVTLALTDFNSVALTANQTAAADGAQSLGAGPLFNAIVLLDDEAEAQGAFDAISGEVHGSAKTALLEDSRFAREAVLERLRGATRGGADETGQTTNLWAQGFGSWSRWSGDGNAARMERDIGGLFIGGDHQIADNVRVGLMGGYNSSGVELDDRKSTASIDSYTLGAYAGGAWDAVSLRGGLAYSWHSIDTSRSVGFTGFSDSLNASYDAHTFQIYTEAAYGIEYGNARFEPFANLAYVDLGTDGFTEDGGPASLIAANQSSDATFTTLGVRGEAQIDRGDMGTTLSGLLSWRHGFGDGPTSTHRFDVGGDAFTVAGVPFARDALVIGAGVEMNLTKNASFGLSYSGQLGSGLSDHGLKANVGVRF